MKRDSMEPKPVFDNRNDKIKYMFKNIYWYHYKWHAFAVLVVGALLISLLVSFITHRDPDIVVLALCGRHIDYKAAETLQNELAEYIGDVNGDGATTADIMLINMADPATEVAARTMLIAQVQRNDIMLVIADPWSLEQVAELFPFRDISKHMQGAEGLVDISGSEKIQNLAPGAELELYAGLVEKEHDDEAHINVPVKAIEFFVK